MKDTEFAFAVARVRANEYRLLSSSVVESLINADGYADALKILSESGYDGICAENEQEVLSRVQKYAFELICESAPDKSCLDFLIVKNDFHNLKAILKCMYSSADPEPFLVSPYVEDPAVFRRAFESKDFSQLNELFSDTAKNAYDLVMTTGDGQSLEVYLDRACIEASVSLAKASKDEFSIKLALLMAALADIKIALRCIGTGKDRDFTYGAIAECSLIDRNELCDAAMGGKDELCAYVRKIGFAALSESIVKGYAAFEKASDDMLIENVRSAKYCSLGISPLVAFYFATDAEIRTVRIILSCKKNGLSVENIRERVRELYV